MFGNGFQNCMIFDAFAVQQQGHLILCVEVPTTEFDLNFTFISGRYSMI